jgi:alkanesulfonate monooxygenase SsuD/methylene tetrahydromethanopterin reductase-like flavin-dependent oxidoreductase (luciferase family)
MELTANFMTIDIDPGEWALRREAEGWDLVACADHFWTDQRPYPHLWVTLAAMACATTTVKLTSSFANNLFRSPVEFAQAALQLQKVSGGRFEAGLGAGWSQDEVTGSGGVYPPPGERAGRYKEAVEIVRALLHEGRCSYRGEYYSIDVPHLGPRVDPPPILVGSLGGPRTMREVGPLVDRIEVKPISAATREGGLDFEAMGAIPETHLKELVERARDVRPDAPLTLFCLCSAGTDDRTRAVEAVLQGGFMSRFFGDPAKVADALLSLEDFGFSRAQVSPLTDETFDLLAPRLWQSGTSVATRR